MYGNIKNRLKWINRVAVLLFMFACQAEKDSPSLTTGNVSVQSNLSINSAVLGREIKYNIILPGSYAQETNRFYPVLYLLHGMGDDNNAWLEKGDAKNLVQKAIKDEVIPEMIVVMPDALVTFYVNNYQDGLNYETFFEEEFMPFIENEYRIDGQRSSRFIAGLSMGGFGASYHAFTYPEKFRYCYSMSGAVEGVGKPVTPSISKLISAYNGEFQNLPDYTLDCGTSDFLVYESNVKVHEELNDLQFEHEYIERQGAHDWIFWKEALPMALERIGSYLIK